MDIKFPANPENGTIFEPIPGLFYQFDASAKSWIRVDGLRALGLATSSTDGLMTPADLKKLEALIIPPPQLVLSSEECKLSFSAGVIAFKSDDDSLNINSTLTLQNGKSVEEPWVLHENTAAIDFKVVVNKILEFATAVGNIRTTIIPGKRGARGPRGDNGIDKLDTGPVGEDGQPGANSPFGAALTAPGVPFDLAQDNGRRALVKIETEEINVGQTKLIATRANIGNPDACPDRVKPKFFNSPWLLVLNDNPANLELVIDPQQDCPILACPQLHYLNIRPLLAAMSDRFDALVNELKRNKEELVNAWLSAMIALFNDQKAALCCALEHCKSTGRNQDARRYIETQRLLAQQGDASIAIDGRNERNTVDLTRIGQCSPVLLPRPDRAPSVVRGKDNCAECFVTVRVDPQIHSTDQQQSGKPSIISGNLTRDLGQTPPLNPRVDASGFILAEWGLPDDDNKAIGHVIPDDVIDESALVPTPLGLYDLNYDLTLNEITIDAERPLTGSIIPYARLTFLIEPTIVGQFSSRVIETEGVAEPVVGEETIVVIKGSAGADLRDTKQDGVNVAKITLQKVTIGFRGNGLDQPHSVEIRLRKLSLSVRAILAGETQAVKEFVIRDTWANGGWSIDGGTFSVPLGFEPGELVHGAVPFQLGPGDYIAEITRCCANIDIRRNRHTGRVAICYNRSTEPLDLSRIAVGNKPFIQVPERRLEVASVFFPDHGEFTSLKQAQDAYLGNTVEFNHIGGEIRVWFVDPEGVPVDNTGIVELCIKRKECFAIDLAPEDITNIFIYIDDIAPENLLGVASPFEGALALSDNFGLSGVGTDPGGPNIKVGPRNEPNKSLIFFYKGSDGLGAYFLHGEAGGPSSYRANIDISVVGNQEETEVKATDSDPGGAPELEVVSCAPVAIGPFPVTATLTDVHFLSNQVGFVSFFDQATSRPFIAKTTDGGITFRFIPVTPAVAGFAGAPKAVEFVSAKTGYTTGGANVFKTIDGGETWDALPLATVLDIDLQDIDFASATLGFVAGANGTIFKTDNGGQTWVLSKSFIKDPAIGRLSGISMGSATVGFAIGASIFRTIDGGKTWIRLARLGSPLTSGDRTLSRQTGGFLNDVHFLHPDVGWFVGPNGVMITRNQGQGITPAFVEGFGALNAVHMIPKPASRGIFDFLNPDGYTVGDNGRILRVTVPGFVGQVGKWEEQDSGTNNNLLGVHFPEDAQTGYVVGENGAFLKTIDGGQTWEIPAEQVELPADICVGEDQQCFEGRWSGSGDGDGGVIGPLDDDVAASWIMCTKPLDLSTLKELSVVSSDGAIINVLSDNKGIGKQLAERRIIFSAAQNACFLFFKQIQWLERAWRHEIGCGVDVTIGGTRYIVIRRSFGIDTECGGGESETNPCVDSFLRQGLGHPAVAWPTFEGLEFAGIPKSGSHPLIRDETLERDILNAIRIGAVTKAIGNPKETISSIITPAFV